MGRSPEVHRTPGLGPAEGLGHWMEADHDRLDELWDRAAARWTTDREAARHDYHDFRDGLLRHIDVEEELLFPYFEERGGLPERHLTELLRSEHKEIRAALAALIVRVDSAAEASEGALTELRNVLWAHNTREEGLLYPWYDGPGSGAEVEALGERVRSRLVGASPR